MSGLKGGNVKLKIRLVGGTIMEATKDSLVNVYDEEVPKKNDIIKFEGVTKNFNDFTAVNNLNLTVKKGEFLSLLGPSGCGKTTTLRMIAGFEHPTKGNIYIDKAKTTNLPPYKRSVNTVFQNYALFPHLTIEENIGFGLKQKKLKKNLVKNKVKEMLGLIGLKEHLSKYPKQLSGGQQQRVALARALINEPQVLLLDEPLGALDLKLRQKMQFELKQIHEKVGITFIYVTHDQEEALVMSDRIAVMNNGNIEQIDTPEKIYNNPKSSFVADFIGEANILQLNQLDENQLSILDKSSMEYKNTMVIRPENIEISDSPLKNVDTINLKGNIVDITFVGAKVVIQCNINDFTLVVHSFNQNLYKSLKVNQKVYMSFHKRNITFV